MWTEPVVHPPVEGQVPLPITVVPVCPLPCGKKVAQGRRLCPGHQSEADAATLDGLVDLTARRGQ